MFLIVFYRLRPNIVAGFGSLGNLHPASGLCVANSVYSGFSSHKIRMFKITKAAPPQPKRSEVRDQRSVPCYQELPGFVIIDRNIRRDFLSARGRIASKN
jgi:hypothetical protein